MGEEVACMYRAVVFVLCVEEGFVDAGLSYARE